MRPGVLIFLFFLPCLLAGQTVISPIQYDITEFECLNEYVPFPDGERWFSGLLVKQARRLYYLDNPYKIEVFSARITLDDYDSYTDKVTVYLAKTAFATMAELKAEISACAAGPGGGTDTIYQQLTIDSINYYGDTLYIYAGGNPVPWTTFIDGCPCEPEPEPEPCAWVVGDPVTGEVIGDPATGQVMLFGYCSNLPAPYTGMGGGP